VRRVKGGSLPLTLLKEKGSGLLPTRFPSFSLFQAGQQMPKVQRAIGLATQVRVPRAMGRSFLAYYVGIKRAEEDSGYA
jgi:hypothetical protein